jgi:hypothetical protein
MRAPFGCVAARGGFVMKAWLPSSQALEQREAIGTEPGMVVPTAYRRVGGIERACLQEVRWAVRAYARDPSAHNASRVERAIAALRRQRMAA